MSFLPRVSCVAARAARLNPSLTRLAAPCRSRVGSLLVNNSRRMQTRAFSTPTVVASSSRALVTKQHNAGVAAVLSGLRRMSSAPKSSQSDPFATTNSPEFKEWSSKDGYFDISVHPVAKDRRKFAYFMMGAARLVYASAIRLAILRIFHYFSAAADLIAFGNTIVKMDAVQLGYTITVMWRGKPVFIRHRPAEEIDAMRNTPMADLKDPQPDEARVKDPAYLIVLGVCTHLGCVPLHNQGDYKGYFCPCHGSHYDASGRIRKGPAPLNLEVPPYRFDGDKVVIGE